MALLQGVPPAAALMNAAAFLLLALSLGLRSGYSLGAVLLLALGLAAWPGQGLLDRNVTAGVTPIAHHFDHEGMAERADGRQLIAWRRSRSLSGARPGGHGQQQQQDERCQFFM